MLTRVLLGHTAAAVAVVVGAGAAVTWLLAGSDAAVAFAIGGLLVGGSGALQVWLVGFLLDPDQGTPQKAAAGLVLVFKLVLVGAILWGLLTRTHPEPLGLLVGMAVGLAAVVFGVNRGSASPGGVSAIEDAERKIREKMEDTEEEKR